MQDGKEKRTPEVKADDPVVLMYPDNQLKAQVRSYGETFSVYTLLKETFFDKK